MPYFKSHNEIGLELVMKKLPLVLGSLINAHGSFNPTDHRVMGNVSFDTNIDICHLKNMLEHGHFGCKPKSS